MTGRLVKGIPTGIAAPIFKDKMVLGDEPIHVWPYVHGTMKGIAIEPLFNNVAKSVAMTVDEDFYALLSLLDAIRAGRAREKNMAIKMLKEILNR